jgi:flagellar motor switch protein FliN/FliY
MADDKSNLAKNIESEFEKTSDASKDDSKKNDTKSEGRDANLNLILDIPLRVTVELGRTKMIVSELLNLGQGSVIELSKLAGEPMEVLVNDKLVARGEAVVVNEKFGVRLTDIISPTERVEQLGSN